VNPVRRVAIAVSAAATLCAGRGGAQAGGGVPWFGFGPVDTVYAMSIDTTVAMSGRWSMLLHSLPGATRATWMATQQIVDARAYRTKRVRIRASLRGYQATWASLWIAVEGFTGTRPATMLSDSLVAPLQGTTSWREALVVFLVDPHAVCIRFGTMLHGTGAVWLDGISFDTVGAGVPVTVRAGRPELLDGDGPDQPNCTGMLPQPANLDFEQPPS
jgi:hypothetical protein